MDYIDTEYNGYPHSVSVKTKGICCTSMESDKHTEIFNDFGKIICALKRFYNNDSNLYVISFISKIGKFNSAEKRKGLWGNLLTKNILFSCSSKEFDFSEDGESILIGYASVEDTEIGNLFKITNPIIVLSQENTISDIFNKGVSVINPESKIKNELLAKNSIIIEIIDLGVDGCSLFLYTQQDNENFDSIKLKNMLAEIC